MAECRVDPGLERVVIDGVQFPLGVYPIEPMAPVQGYTVDFEPADGDDIEGEWEEWPDRYVFEVVVSAERLPAFLRALFLLLPSRVYPILDVLGHDAYREIDPYISYDLLGKDRLMDGILRWRGLLLEDGMCGFGAMSESPFFYIFVDEHKVVTVRAEPEWQERIERVLDAFDLGEVDEVAGADAAAHEHRSVLFAPDDQPELLTSEEIIEWLREDWRLTLNIDHDANIDDAGQPLGVAAWRCLLRTGTATTQRYLEVLLTAGSLRQAIESCRDAMQSVVDSGEDSVFSVIASDRVTPEQLRELMNDELDEGLLSEERIIRIAWLE